MLAHTGAFVLSALPPTSTLDPERNNRLGRGVGPKGCPSSNTGMGDPPAETGGTTHPAQEVEKSGVKEEPKTPTEATDGQHTGVVWEPQAASLPAESRRSASEAAPPAKAPVWPVVVTDEPIRLHMDGWPRWGTRFSWKSSPGRLGTGLETNQC